MKVRHSHIKGFRELARKAAARKQFDCGHDATKVNTILQRRGRDGVMQKECRCCFVDKRADAARQARALRDKLEPGWRERLRELKRLNAQKHAKKSYIVYKAHRDIAQEMSV